MAHLQIDMLLSVLLSQFFPANLSLLHLLSPVAHPRSQILLILLFPHLPPVYLFPRCQYSGNLFFLLFLAYYVLQVEVASVCFGISAFLSHGGMGVGLGMAALLYFLNIITNLTEDAKFLKYITPFGYTEGADIIADECLNMEYLSVGLVFTVIGISAGFYRYCKKDIL